LGMTASSPSLCIVLMQSASDEEHAVADQLRVARRRGSGNWSPCYGSLEPLGALIDNSAARLSVAVR
jgi:hypothetical protein